MKKCTKCGAVRPLVDFGSNVRTKDKLQRACKTCTNKANDEWKSQNLEKYEATRVARKLSHPNERRKRSAEYYQENRARLLVQMKEYRDKVRLTKVSVPKKPPKGKDPIKRKEALERYKQRHGAKIAARACAWNKANPDVDGAFVAKRRARKKQATTPWSNDFFVKEIYRLAHLRTKVTGFKWEVDHIVPLQSPIVCGLHCEANLQVIPRQINLKKSNVYWPDMP